MRHCYGPMKFFGTMMKARSAWRSAAGSLGLLMLLDSSAKAQASAPEHPAQLRALNTLRKQGCKGRPGPAALLRENTSLSRATALVAGGSKFHDALKAADYRAVRAAQITLRSTAAAAALARAAVGKSCSSIMQGGLAEAGFHRRGSQT